MSRLLRFATLSAFVLSSQPVFAQDASPQSPFDLARALRDSDQPELALEYLDDCAKTLPPEWQVTLPIERAKARIRVAAPETDEVKRDTLVNAAKGELEQFLKANGSHPRAAEAAMSLANVASLQGKSQLSRAGRIPDIAGRKAAAALARPFFEDASAKFQKAAAALETAVNVAETPNQKRDLTRELYQTILDQGINRYYLGESYVSAEGKPDIDARYAAYKSAQDIFSKLGDRKPEHPLGWVAKAWAGECYYPMSETAKAELAFAKIKTDAAKNPNGPGLAGVRQARFFEIRDKWIQAGKTNTGPAYANVRQLCEKWLADYRTFRTTTETYAIIYYNATTKLDEGKLGVKVDEKTKAVTVNPNVLPLLKDADKDFRRLADTENEYTSRANRMRPEVMLLLVGNADKKPQDILTFEECHLTSLVQLDKYQKMNAADKATPEEKQAQLARVIALLEREKQLPVPKESLRDSLNSQVMLVYIYRISDQPYQAAVLGEYIAHASKGPTAAKAGLNAMLAYLEAVEKSDQADVASRAADTAKAMAVASYLDATIPDDASTDEARFQGARLLVNTSRYIEAFNLLNRITARYPNLTKARLLQGGIAYELLRPRGVISEKNPPPKFALPLDAQKPALFKTATIDLAAVPVANPATPAAAAVDYCRLQNQLAQIYLTSSGGYAVAEKIANDIAALIPTLTTLPAVEKETLPMEAEMLRINAIYGQAMPLHQEKKYKESADRYSPMIAAIEKSGPAVKAGQNPAVAPVAKKLDDLRLRNIVVPTLNSRVAEGQLEEAGKLLDMLKRLGSTQDQIVNAVFQVVMASKPQIDQLKKEGKNDEAAKVSTNLSTLAARISGADAKLTSVQLLDLGKIFKELGDYDKAAGLLLRIPAPANPAFLKADPAQPPESDPTDAPPVKKMKDDALAAWKADKAATTYYRVGQLELMRTYRLGNQLPKAEELIGTILGKDKTKPGWGASFPDFRKEGLMYLEAKAANTADGKEALKIWIEAKTGWEALGREYYQILVKPLPAGAKPEDKAKLDQQKAFVKPIYFDLVVESIRCLTRAQLQVNGTNAPVLKKSMDSLGKQLADIEKKNPDIGEVVKVKIVKLLDDVPQLRESYKAAGGEWLNPPK